MHTHPTSPVQRFGWLGCFFIVYWMLVVSVTAILPAVADKHYKQVARINNGGDAPPLVELSYVKADDPEQIAAGDAVAHVTGSQEKVLHCNSVWIRVLVVASEADPRKPLAMSRETPPGEGQLAAHDTSRPFEADPHMEGQPADLVCTMWVRKVGTNIRRIRDLSTSIDLLRDHDQNGVILTLALRNFSDVDFHGSFKMINVLPDDLAFDSTLAIEEWTGLPIAPSRRARASQIEFDRVLSSKLTRQALLRDVIAFQEHLHGQALIYQAKAVKIPSGGAVVVNYVANVSWW